MANITPDYLRGFLIPSISISKDNLWDAQSNYSQANPRSGVPEAQSQGVNLTVSSIGTQTEEITLNTIQGGLPGDALFTWKGEDSIDLGKDAPYILTEAGYWIYSSTPVTARYTYSDCVASLDGTLWVVSERETTGNVHTVSISRQEKNGAIANLNTFVSLPGTFSTDAIPAITRLQDGSLLVAYFQYTTETSSNIKVHRSIDNGDTWKEISPRGLNVGVFTGQYTPVKMRMVSIDNAVVLFIELEETLNPNRLSQYVSRDGGTTFTLVDSISDFGDGRFHEPSPVALPDGSIGIAYLTDEDELHFTKIPTPGIRASSAFWRADNQYEIDTSGVNFALKTGDQLTLGNVTTWYQDGKIWVVAQEYGNGRLIGYYSEDFGVTWDYATGNSSADGIILDYGSNTDRLQKLSSCVHEGRAKIIGHELNSVWMLAYGGYSSFSYPGRSISPTRNNYLLWDSTYIPVVLPGTSTQYTTIGVGSQSLDDEGLDLSTSGNTRYYRYSHSGNYFTEGQVIRLRLQVDANNGGVLNNYIAFRVTQDDTVNSTELILRFSPSTIQVRDSAGIKATITHDMRDSTEIVIGITDTAARIYYRTYDGAQAKKWNLQSITGITKGASGAGNRIEWGHLAFSGVLTFRSHWQEVSISSGEEAGLFDFALRGATYPPLGEYQYIDEGLAITAKDAPARGEDEYKITPRYDYGIENIFHKISLSPRVVWRSADQSFQQIPLFVDPIVQDTEKSLGCSDMFGIHLSNINFRLFKIKVWNGASWNTFASVDTSADYTSTYIKKGNTLISNSATKDFLLRYGEAIGWRARLYDPVSKDVAFVKIIMNSEGIWSTDSGVKQAVIQYDTTITDPSTIPANGEIFLIPDSVTFLKARLDGVNLGQYAWMLEVSAQDRLEDYFQIGSMLMGSVAFPAPQYQRGRTITYSPNIQTQSSLDGMFFSRKMSAGRRTASIAWTEPIDPTRLNDLNPDYWQVSVSSGAQPVANYGDPHLLEGIFRYLNNREPLVYLPSIKQRPTNDEILLTARDSHMLCRTTGEITVESVLGEERLDEMFRVSTVNLEEIE